MSQSIQNNFWACKPSIHSYSTIYRSGEKTGGPGGVPLGIPLPKKDHVTNQWILSTYSPLKLKGSRACPPRIYSPRSDPSKTDGGSRGCPPRNASSTRQGEAWPFQLDFKQF
jgi:hypothetical protein